MLRLCTEKVQYNKMGHSKQIAKFKKPIKEVQLMINKYKQMLFWVKSVTISKSRTVHIIDLNNLWNTT